MNMAEAERIALALNISLQEFIEKYTDPRWKAAESILIRQQNGKCAFLGDRSGESRCSIHKIKPSSCLEFTAGLEQKECREGLLQVWGLSISNMGEIQGTPEKVKAFLDYLDSLSD